jgi:chromosome segregation protein
LTKLELHGFKSFADQTEMIFEPGVTAIVGPNGCGKSNVSDAVRWVLGEQRARALRGAKMDEVIFQGSSGRRPVNVAEVSLHFDNDDGALPIAFREVVITRRLSRSGDSEYLLNRAPCRLRDIQDLVRGTGLGADSGVVIESKMIDALLSDRPDERRELFEEAAGVGLYRDRRRSAERRFEETTLDLSRLDDVIGEVQSQVRSLSRQRKRAERHAELTARRFTVEIALAAREMEAWRDELSRLEKRVAALRDEAPAAERRVGEAEKTRDEAHAARAVAEGRRAELARLVATLREGALELQGEIAVAEERQRNALARRARAEAERREGEAQGMRLGDDQDRARAERARLEGELAGARTQARDAQREEESARAMVVAARSAVDAAEESARAIRDRVRRLELDREAAERETAETSIRVHSLENERATLLDEVAAAERQLQTATDEVEIAREAAEAATAARDEARTAAAAAREREAAARGELFRADETLTSLQGKVNALEALERERVGLAPAAARLLRERDRLSAGAVLGPLSDFISADAADALSVERFLGPTVHAILVRDRAAADEVRAWHQASNPGPLLLLPVAEAPHSAADATPTTRESSLAARVTATEPARPWVRALLGRVAPLGEGDAFVDARGAIWLPGTAGGPGPLRRRAELYALRTTVAEASEARSRASAAADEAREGARAADEIATATTERAAEAARAVRVADERRTEAERRLRRVERAASEAGELAAKLTERRDALAARVVALAEQSANGATEVVEREAALIAARERLAAAEAEHDDARERRTRTQVEEAQANARLQMAMDREKRLAEEHASAAARLDALHSELASLSAADSTLAEQMAHWHAELDARRATAADGESRLAAAEEAVRAADELFATAEHQLDEVRRTATALAEESHHAELRLTELSGRRASIRERLEMEWRRPVDELLAEVAPMEIDDASLRAEAESIRTQLDALGPVNPLAIEEHEEELKRVEFLTSQRADLAAAKLSLQQAIREIDTTARELFLTTFAQVRENFRQIFMTLFGGGECDLRLENPEAPLDCDIEIHASPRGKRTQRIHLLSSGERALVALSLLFGIFLTKPSPFCLLDEVDAPLDDQNVGRFVRMLTQFKSRTQFIVITHNPRTTTEAADAVYGVTMQDLGVSSVVSVRMRGAAIESAIAGRTERVEAAAASV